MKTPEEKFIDSIIPAPSPWNNPPKPDAVIGRYFSNKTPLTKKQNGARKKARASKKARRRGK